MTRWFYVAVALTAAAFAGSAYVYLVEYDRLPARIPIHWNFRGEPDDFVSKEKPFVPFFLLPTCMAGFLALFFLLPWISPRGFDVGRFRRPFEYTMTVLVAMFGYIHLTALVGSLRQMAPGELGRWVVGGIFLFLVLLGNVMGQIRRNFWVGVRTPWTLASDAVWIQTHRLTAWLMVAGGLAAFVAVLAGVSLLWCLVGLLPTIVLVPIVYSFVAYKRLERAGRV